MKTNLLVIVGLLISLSAFSQNLINNALDSIGLKFVSGGRYTIVVKPGLMRDVAVDDFWMSNEISNKEFRKFYTDIINNPNDTITWVDFSKIKSPKRTSDKKITKSVVVKEAYKDISPKIIDLSVSNSIPNKENYFTDSKYDNYPVVGVTYYGAMYYCIWRSNLENNDNARFAFFEDSVYYPDTNLWYEYDLIGDTLLITKENNYKVKVLINKISSDSMTLNYLDYGVIKTFKKR